MQKKIQAEQSDIVTRKILKEELDSRFERFMFRIVEILRAQRDEFHTMLDPFLREIEEAREDRILTTGTLANHEKRLVALEHN